MIGVVLASLSLIAILAREQHAELLIQEASAHENADQAAGIPATSRPQRLLLVGGGKRPPLALEHWISWAVKPGKPTRVLILAWASEKPRQAIDSLTRDLKSAGADDVIVSVAPPERELEVAYFLRQMDEADAVFFSGGDQTRILEALKHPHVARRLRIAYWQNGIPFAGTSAGTAVMSETIILGGGPQADHLDDLEEVKGKQPLRLGEGLGFLPGAVTDQHFVIRERTPRLRKALIDAQKKSSQPLVGVGIEEDCAILFERQPDSSIFRGIAMGPRHSIILIPLPQKNPGSTPKYRQTPLHPGETTEVVFDPLTHRDCAELMKLRIGSPGEGEPSKVRADERA